MSWAGRMVNLACSRRMLLAIMLRSTFGLLFHCVFLFKLLDDCFFYCVNVDIIFLNLE